MQVLVTANVFFSWSLLKVALIILKVFEKREKSGVTVIPEQWPCQWNISLQGKQLLWIKNKKSNKISPNACFLQPQNDILHVQWKIVHKNLIILTDYAIKKDTRHFLIYVSTKWKMSMSFKQISNSAKIWNDPQKSILAQPDPLFFSPLSSLLLPPTFLKQVPGMLMRVIDVPFPKLIWPQLPSEHPMDLTFWKTHLGNTELR